MSLVEPRTTKEALMKPNLIIAMQEQPSEFKRNNVWKMVPKPKGHTIVDTRWVYKNKLDESGAVVRNKARMVAKGYSQLEGVDYDEMYAPVARNGINTHFLSIRCTLKHQSSSNGCKKCLSEWRTERGSLSTTTSRLQKSRIFRSLLQAGESNIWS
ncbi:uncharacterized mitochondrial protein AtMg00820-like [Lactuca sativa]|uniref:uncharacterized mitochondrial protein AtMg00820-like n=1 Tax=Lactuca sativa TaxID=4236 RepID=UPI000CD89913|nr:uncharacterized mitochondrial protein AtMg00820-like [Lactuca sativa]